MAASANDDAKAAPHRSPKPSSNTTRDLDPADWGEFRRLAHATLDQMISHIETIRDRPVWQPAPAATRARFDAPLPTGERALGDVLDDVATHIAPFTTGNIHPRFMGWVHGAGTPVGMLAEMVAAGLNMNCGGRDHIGLEIERQITRWMAAAAGFPGDASGIFVTGTSMANFPGRSGGQVCGRGCRDAQSRSGKARPPAGRLRVGRRRTGCVAQPWSWPASARTTCGGSRSMRQAPWTLANSKGKSRATGRPAITPSC